MEKVEISLEDWVKKPTKEQLDELQNRDKVKKYTNKVKWKNTTGIISPITIYSYLKARFGPPNGIITLMNNPTTDNLTHWHYVLDSEYATLNILGMATGIEMFALSKENYSLSDESLNNFISLLIEDFKKKNRIIRQVKSELEHWSLFINPFARIEHALQEYLNQLEKLDLTEPNEYRPGSETSIDEYKVGIGDWAENIRKAASLGMTIRMLCPILLESFVNLVLLIFRREEYRVDHRLYDNLVRQHIDIRVKSLNINCTCFENQIDSNSIAFKKFHTLMNKRNDFLHGNIDPDSLVIEDVWFDQNNIPLFEKDEGIIKKTIRNYCTNVEPKQAFDDFQTVSDFIELILMAMDDDSCRLFVRLMSDEMPGKNNKTQNIGLLFNSDMVVEGYFN